MFDQTALQELRDILESVWKRRGLDSVSERYDLKYTMNRLADLVFNDLHPREADKPPITEIENIDELVAKLIVPGPSKRQYRKKEHSIRKRRPRADFERDVALALAIIYHEYTGAKPTRISKNFEATTETFARDKTSPFYRFATAAFNGLGLKLRDVTFREATEWWERSRDFRKKSFQLLLWGRLPNGIAGQPDLRWHEKKLRRRSSTPSIYSIRLQTPFQLFPSRQGREIWIKRATFLATKRRSTYKTEALRSQSKHSRNTRSPAGARCTETSVLASSTNRQISMRGSRRG
jgi:hypothetical protein